VSRYQPRHVVHTAAPSSPGRDPDEVGAWSRAVLWLILVACVGGAGAAASILVLAERDRAVERAEIADVSPEDADAAADVPLVERPERPVNAPAPQALAPSPAVYVEIPAIGVRSDLEALDLGEDGALRAPTDYDVAGWFAAGTAPGSAGPAVIAGHVDSTDGPAVFYRLDELGAGDEVLVGREDGQVVRFVVTDVQRHPKDAFPADAVYGPVPGAELRLVTCDGVFDRAAGSYHDNLVVFAVAADRPQLG
jgi:sortase (surface protein transpeptidase)